MKKVGVFGGSFDPVHLGHLLLAEQCLHAADLDQIAFVPAAIPPHKQDMSLTRSDHRVEMLRLAIGGNEKFQIERCELERDGVSFTVDTLEYLKGQDDQTELFLLIGGDSLDEFHTWKDPGKICSLATPLIVERPGADPIDLSKLESYGDSAFLSRVEKYSFRSRLIEISSREIREKVSKGESIRYLTPRSVEQFILEKQLYGNPESENK